MSDVADVIDRLAQRAARTRVGDRLVVFVSTGDVKVSVEQAAFIRGQLLDRLPEVDDVFVVPGESVSVQRVRQVQT